MFNLKKIKIEYKYIVALIYTCVLFIDRLDITLINIAIPSISKHFSLEITDAEWVTTGYLLALAIIIPVSSWLSDKFGDKKVFIIANFFILFGALFSAFSWNIECMIFFRIIQGIGGGILVPVGMSMTYRVFQQSEYSKVASYTLIPTLIAPAIAPTLGGIILQYFNWKWIFLLHVPPSILAIILSFLFLKETKEKEIKSLDWQGFILASTGLTLLLYIISRMGHTGIEDTYVILGFIFSIIIFIQFIFCEKKQLNPLLDLSLFKNQFIVQANIMQFFLQICYFGSIFLVALYFQICVGMKPFMAGLSIFTQPIGTILIMPMTAALFNRYGPKNLLIIGMLGIAITSYLILFIRTPNQIILAAFIMFIRGVFIGLVNVPVQATAMLNVSKQDTGRATSLFNASRQVTISLGIALSSMILKHGYENLETKFLKPYSTNAIFYVYNKAFLFIAIFALFGAAFACTFNNKKIKSVISKHL